MKQKSFLTGNKETDRRRLKALLKLNGLSTTDVARELKCTRQLVFGTIHRDYTSPRVMDYLKKLPCQI